MKTFAQFVLVVVVFFVGVFAARTSFAGGKTAGDGGHVVVCESARGTSVTLLDLAEGFHEGLSLRPDLATPEAFSGSQSWYVRAIEPLRAAKRLGGSEAGLIQWFAPYFEQVADTRSVFPELPSNYRPPIPTSPLASELPGGCSIRTIVKTEERRYRTYGAHFCSIYPELCFSVDRDLWASLDRLNRRCLAIHEALRYLNEELSETEIRRHTRRACMN
ncbi:MAG: hypothetical protein V4760_13810 [Bdellovibrionota bacterium]